MTFSSEADQADRGPIEVPVITQRERVGRSQSRVVRVLAVALVLLFFLVITRLNGASLASKRAQMGWGFERVVAEAFSHGNLDMGPAPVWLLRLSDPYDPAQNAGTINAGLHVFSLYAGRIYSYFGPTPAVTLTLPFEALGLGYLSSRLAKLLCITRGIVACAAAKGRCIDRWARDCPSCADLLSIVGVGMGSLLAWQIYVGPQHEVPIVSGFLWASIVVGALLRALDSMRRMVLQFVLAGAVIGLSARSRPHLLLNALFLVVAPYVVMQSANLLPGWRFRPSALFIPVALIALLIMLDNNARFESPFQFGCQNQLAGVSMRVNPSGELSYLPTDLADYLFAGYGVVDAFPYVYLVWSTDTNNFAVHGHEFISGFVISFPWISVGLAVFSASNGVCWKTTWNLLLALGSLLVVATLSLLLVSAAFNASTLRYLVDFVPWFAVLAAVFLSFAIWTTQFSASVSSALIAIWTFALVWCDYAGFAFAVDTCRSINKC